MKNFNKITTTALIAAAIASSHAFAQERVQVGAYDPAHANGIVIVANNQNFFGLRFLIYQQGARVESSARQLEPGPAAANGAYAQLAWRSLLDDKTPLTLRWTRLGGRVVIGRLTAPASVRVAIEAYRPWESSEAWAAFSVQADRRGIFGEQIQTATPPLRRFLLRLDRTAIGAANTNDADAIRTMLLKDGHVQQSLQPEQTADAVVSHFSALSFDLGQNQSIGFVAVVGDDFDAMERETAKLLQKPILEFLDQAEKNHENVRPMSSGALGDSVETLSRTFNWNRYYWAEKSLEFISINRQARGELRGVTFGWDTFFAGTMEAMFDGAMASSTLHAMLEGQTPDGRVPLRRSLYLLTPGEMALTAGRSSPPLGALAVWRVYLATRDLELLAWAYPRLKQSNEWWLADRGDGQAWRDGNGDGLLEYGYDAEAEQGALGARMLSNEAKRRLAFSESGLDDRPQWVQTEPPSSDAANSGSSGPGKAVPPDAAKFNDRTRTLEFSTVGINALYALDTETMALIARELGLLAESGQWQARYEKLRTIINDKLWSEQDGLYLNRHWDGRLSRRLSLENFYPLLAGIADEERAKRMLDTLRDGKRFGFGHPLPAIARDDPLFDGKTAGRGAAWAPMNYLLYLGLKRYGFHEEAAELARKNNAAARAALEKTGRLPDLLSSMDDGAIENDASTQRAAFAGLMLMPAIEELISTDPWAGLTLGSTATTEENRIERLNFSGGLFDVIAGPKRTVVRRNGQIEVECEAPARLRAYRVNDRAIGFGLEIKDTTRVLIPAAEGKKITVSVDEKVLGSTSVGASASFRVQAGVHKVLIVR